MGKTHLNMGLLAHVDSGKTSMSEAILYETGTRRIFGRVDHRDAFLDTHGLERERGITIFSKQAIASIGDLEITLVDTPGHGDFSPEAERVFPILDCALLIISGTDGIQAHTVTLWQLLEKYHIPTFIFINKMDLPGLSKEEILSQLQSRLHPGCLDFTSPDEESIAMCDDDLLTSFLETGSLTKEQITSAIAKRQIFPCLFGSALKLTGIEELLTALTEYTPVQTYGDDFGAKVYKISRDAQGNRLTWLKITGGKLTVRSTLSYKEKEEKVVQIRLYSGEKFTATDTACAGQLCAVTGLSETHIGQGFGTEPEGTPPVLTPVMTYGINLPEGYDKTKAIQALRLLQEEEPSLQVVWEERTQQLSVRIMGKVQLEILQRLLAERFSLEVTFGIGRVVYQETILAPIEGVGHFEPLRHYAEAHILLEPLPLGSGLQFDSTCSTDILPAQYRNLIMSHMREKSHLGVLTGSPITDMKLTLVAGKAHVKHTEGGDFRQATYRAIRHGLMRAKSCLLEPIYSFMLTIPQQLVGRAMTDIEAMAGHCEMPEAVGEFVRLTGRLPAARLGDYPEQVAAYSQGRGQLQIAFYGYAPCHNADAVIAELGYQPEADLENTPDSVFCDHGAGVAVKWTEVENYMHIPYTTKGPL